MTGLLGLLGAVGPAESLKSGNSQKRCSPQPQAPSSHSTCSCQLQQPPASSLPVAAVAGKVQAYAGRGRCRCMCRRRGCQSEKERAAWLGGSSQNGRMAAMAEERANRHTSQTRSCCCWLLIIMTLNSCLCSWGASIEPVASVCPSQDRHQATASRRSRRVRRPTANCVLVLARP